LLSPFARHHPSLPKFTDWILSPIPNGLFHVHFQSQKCEAYRIFHSASKWPGSNPLQEHDQGHKIMSELVGLSEHWITPIFWPWASFRIQKIVKSFKIGPIFVKIMFFHDLAHWRFSTWWLPYQFTAAENPTSVNDGRARYKHAYIWQPTFCENCIQDQFWVLGRCHSDPLLSQLRGTVVIIENQRLDKLEVCEWLLHIQYAFSPLTLLNLVTILDNAPYERLVELSVSHRNEIRIPIASSRNYLEYSWIFYQFRQDSIIVSSSIEEISHIWSLSQAWKRWQASWMAKNSYLGIQSWFLISSQVFYQRVVHL
jgi:hypothetical protein